MGLLKCPSTEQLRKHQSQLFFRAARNGTTRANHEAVQIFDGALGRLPFMPSNFPLSCIVDSVLGRRMTTHFRILKTVYHTVHTVAKLVGCTRVVRCCMAIGAEWVAAFLTTIHQPMSVDEINQRLLCTKSKGNEGHFPPHPHPFTRMK